MNRYLITLGTFAAMGLSGCSVTTPPPTTLILERERLADVQKVVVQAPDDIDPLVIEELSTQSTLEAVAEGGDGRLEVVLTNSHERSGSAVGSAEPASVGFEARLVDRHGATVWLVKDFIRDQAFTENILTFGQRVKERGGFGWSTRDQMLRARLRLAFASLEEARRTGAHSRQ